jgi:hypothetical protein
MKYQRFLVLLIAFLIIFIVSVTYNEAQSEDTWAISTVDSTGYVGYFTSIAIDSNNKIHISYCDGTNDALKYATNVLGSWTTYTIDSPGYAGESTSIAIDLNYRCLAPCFFHVFL